MGKITSALKKAAEERMERIERIQRIKERDRLVIQKMGDSKVDNRIITYFDPKAVISEQYKILRTNVMALNRDRPLKTLVLTSSIHSEGKTITAVNLAVALSQDVSKPRVLLIDADMRRGRVVKYLGVTRDTGLSDILAGGADLEQALFHIDIDNLAFLPCGATPENPSELLASKAMKRLLSDVRATFDHVIIDTPPIIPVTDAGIVGALADGVILVIQAGRTQRGIVRRSTELLHQSHARVMGHVLTAIEYHLPEYIYRYL